LLFSPLERMIAFRYLRSKRSEGFISVIAGFSFLGIALGVATLIIVMAVMNGFRSEITNKILGFTGHITVSSFAGGIPAYDEVADTIRQVEGVELAIPLINGQAMATTRGQAMGALVKAMTKEDLAKRKLIADSLLGGTLEDFSGNDAIIMGSQLAINLGVFIGDKITLIAPKGRATAIGTIPRMKSYTLVATFDSGMYEYDSSTIFMPLEAGQLFFQYPNSVSAIEVETNDPHNVQEISNAMIVALNGEYSVQDWQMVNAGLFSALKVERTVMFLILTLIVFIAAFNIISSLIMLVNDKGRDIAILRTMGATRTSIMKVFFLCGSSIGVVGTLLGFALGVSFAMNIESIRSWLEELIGTRLFDPVIYFLAELPAEIQTSDVIWAVMMGLGFSFLATIYPAWKASKQDPAEVLRYE
jgi:lipoprotein-releasing system permease protein